MVSENGGYKMRQRLLVLTVILAISADIMIMAYAMS